MFNSSLNASAMEPFDNETSIFQISPGILNILVLLAGSVQMYNGIEISHPIYATLFFNMIVTLLSSVVDIFVFPFVYSVKYTTLVNGNSALCVLFHVCGWFVLSVLRYFYIVHPTKLHNRFPKPRVLSGLSIVSLVVIFMLSCVIVLGTLVHFGWPQVKIYHMETRPKFICLATILSINTAMLSLSCLFYILVLRQRGKLGVNQVAVLAKAESHLGSPAEDLDRIWTGQAVVQPPASIKTTEGGGSAPNDANEARVDVLDELADVEGACGKELVPPEENSSLPADVLSEDLSVHQASQPTKDLVQRSCEDDLRSLDQTPPQSNPSNHSDAAQQNSNVMLSSYSIASFLSNADATDGNIVSEVDIDRRETEINAAVRSLKTNLLLCATFVILAAMFSVMPDIAVVIGSVMIKGITPIVTALVNFGKLQSVAKLYWENTVEAFRKAASYLDLSPSLTNR